MNIIFFGSSKYSTIVEEALHKTLGLSLVVTVADKINSKTKELTPSPVKSFAKKHSIPVIAVDSLTDEIIDEISYHKGINFSEVSRSARSDSGRPDFLVVADYGLILPKKVLELPKIAPINVHHSLLPKYRGPAPVPFALLAGEKLTGVSIIIMNDKVDAGDILAQKECAIENTDTTDSLLTKINTLGGQLVVDVIKDFENYFKNRTKQNENEATFTGYMEKSDGFIDLKNVPAPEKLDRMVRAYYPWPGAWTTTMINGKGLRIKLLPSSSHPELVESQRNLAQATVSGSSHILLQPEGKKPMSIKDFINGYPEGKALLEKLGLL